MLNVFGCRCYLGLYGDGLARDGGAGADGADGACLDEVERDGSTDADLGRCRWRHPEAVEVAPVVLAALTVSVRLEVTERPSGMVASASLSAMLTATAAATLTLPSDVLAEGVDASPLESPTPSGYSNRLRYSRSFAARSSSLSTCCRAVFAVVVAVVGPPARALAMPLAALVRRRWR